MIKSLNYNELRQICKHSQAVGLYTLKDLFEYIKQEKIKSKEELLYRLNELFCEGKHILELNI